MARNTFQDVVPRGGEQNNNQSRDRSIRNIPITKRSQKNLSDYTEQKPIITKPHVEEDIHRSEADSNGYKMPSGFFPKNKKTSKSKVFISLALLVIIGFIFVIMNVFTSANIDITPKKESVTFNLAVSAAGATAKTASSSASYLKYEVIEIKKDGEKEVVANGEENAELKASGRAVIYNNFSPEPQRLITRTRFETPEGLIYRINDPVVVPGKVGSTPGSIEVTLYADEAGAKYNIGLKDFTIPGFKSDSVRYKGFYARSKTEMTGGLVGKVKKVAAADKNQAILEIENSLIEEIEKDIIAEVPEESVVLKGGIIYDKKDLPQEDSGSKVLIKREVKAYALAFKKSDIASLVQSQFLKNWAGTPSKLGSFENISMIISSPDWMPGDNVPLDMKISGSGDLIAVVDPDFLKEALASKNKTELANIIKSSTSIESARASIRPIWKNAFPDNASKIHVKLDY